MEYTRPQLPLPSLQWDVNTAFAAYIVAALVFLLVVRRGFTGFVAP